MEWVLDCASRLTPTEIIVVIGPDMQPLADSVAPHKTVIQTVADGTGGALRAALPHLKTKGKVLVLLGDEPFLSVDALTEMINLADHGIAMMALDPAPLPPTGLGRVVVAEDGTLNKIIEEKDCDEEQRQIRLCNAGNFCFPADRLAAWCGKLGRKNAQGEYYLTDLPEIAAQDSVKTQIVQVRPGHVWGINTRAQLADHERVFQMSMRMQAMAAGVTLTDPESVYFSWDIQIAADVTIGPHVYFGPGVSIGTGTIVHAFSHIEGAQIGEYAEIGPFARIRPQSKIGDHAVAGNFIEVNRSEMKAGAKAKHLSYLGDTVVGEKANIGAGTVVANYDGKDKHDTHIGSGVFVGSNTTLIAPVTIGDKAKIAGGSTVTDDVPQGATAFGRARQVNKTKK